MNKYGAPRSYRCSECNNDIVRVDSHRFNNRRYCNECWEFYQHHWELIIQNWVLSQGDNIRSLDCFPQFKGKGYYALSNGDIYFTKFIYKPKGADTFKTFYLDAPRKYEVKGKPVFKYGKDRNWMNIKDIIYTLFIEPFDKKKFIIVNKDYDEFNNAVDNLIKFPRKKYLHHPIYYAVKNGFKIAESPTIQGLARIIGMNEYTARRYLVTGRKTRHGIYLKKEE